MSNEVDLKYGLPQGSVLGPALFKIYIRSLYDHIGSTGFRIEGFADDHQLIKQFIVQLQAKTLGEDNRSCLAHIATWMNEFFLMLNHVVHGVFVENQCIRFVCHAKNLGVVLDEELSFEHHINKIIKASYATIKKLTG